MKILVTGHKGYIGSKLYNKLIEQGHDVLGIDLKDGDNILYCLPDKKVDYVFHLAAYPKVSYSVENPSFTMRQNVLSTSVLLEWCKNNKVKRFIFSSSAAVNDGNPQSPYGLHKFISEKECEVYSNLYDLDTVCLRYFNVYSEDQKYGGAYSTIISAWMEMIRQNKNLRIDGDGSQTRDFIHVDDIISANIFCMKQKENFKGKILNIGTGSSVSINYIKQFIDSRFDISWDFHPPRAGDIKNSIADISEINKIGWKSKISIKEGLDRCFKKAI